MKSQLCSESFVLMKEPNSKGRKEGLRQQFLQCLWDGPPATPDSDLEEDGSQKQSWLGLFSTCNHPPSTPHPALCPEADLEVTAQLFLCSLASGHGGVCPVPSTIMREGGRRIELWNFSTHSVLVPWVATVNCQRLGWLKTTKWGLPWLRSPTGLPVVKNSPPMQGTQA